MVKTLLDAGKSSSALVALGWATFFGAHLVETTFISTVMLGIARVLP